ncbi:hypothetical protein B9Z55_002760 [Caenorhabditis nigoni]|uniref:CCHC-type domain-containing protein n=1 Tax=Caenorhabditis nigoni TaxID=1611254 RepID=A0A2G5VLZ6_9PELO|nr:hypothetical protein B9Z55_002760 [Caenorhabditis nigoni]
MSLTTARKNLTRGVNTVKTTIEDVEPHLVKWQKATADEIGNFEEECQSWFRILFKQLERMKTFSKELNEEADKLVDPTDDELKKEEEYVQKYVDALDLGSNTLDRIEEQCERCNGESPRGKALEQSLQIRRLELFEPSEYGSIRNGSNRNMSREHLPDNGVEAIGTQQTMVMMPQQHVILDRPRLPKFDGKPWEFENFWTMFQEFVGNTNKSNLRKMNELINSLEGEPKELLKKFRLSNETYQPAVELLHKKYNDGEKIIAVLTGRLAEEKATSGQISEQRRVLDQINIIVDQLCEFKENVDNRMMKNEILKKFSNTIRKEVLMLKLDVPPDEWTTAKLLEILEFTISRQEELQEAMKETNPTHPEKSNKDQNTRDSQHKAGDKKRFNPDQKKGPFCTYCKQKGHFSDRCNEVTKIEDRKKILVNESRCLQCLQKGHQTNACENRPCYTCERKGHHSSLCFSKKKNESTEKKQSEDKSKQKPKTTAVANIELKEEEDGDEGSKESSVATTVATRGYIPTLRTSAQNPSNGEWEAISTMLDSGADQTYIRRDLAEKWKLPNEGTETFNLRTFGSQESKSITFEKTTILIKAGKKTLDMKALVSENLAGRVWKARLTKDDMEHMIKKKMDINEDVFEDVVEPQLIIGCDYLSDLMIGNMITLPSGVKLIKTHMGYTTMGPEKIKKQDKDESGNGKESHHLMAYDEDPTAEVQRDIEEKQKFDMQMKTEQEFTGPMADEIAEIDKKVMEFFEDTIVKKEDGYEVRYPFKQSWTEIPDNLPIAIKRLQSVVRTQPREVLQMVQKVFDDQEEQGIIERVDPDEHTTNLVRYNPTHPVLTPNKTTTKCRVVVDGSSHGRGDQSINELLHKGPILMPDLVEMQSGKGFRTAIHRRSINHIVPLELDNESETEETVMEEPTVPEVEEEPQEEPKRYNLRKRKEVNYEDDDDVHNTLAHNSIFGVLGNSIIFTIAMVMMMIVGVHSEAAEVNCNYQGLQIKGDYKSFEACSEDFCTSNTRFAWNFNNEKKDIWLPPAIKIRPHHCSVKISDGKQITVKEITCPAIPFCQTIDCTFCMTNLLNPECHLPFAIIGLGAVVFLLLMCLHIICNVPITLGAPVAMGWRITWMILGQLYQRCRRFIRPRQRNRWLGGMVIIFWLMQSIQCCQNIDIVEQKQKICRDEGTETHCEMFTEEMIVLNQAQREGCLRLSKNSTVLWEYKFKLEDVTMKCIKETVVFTKPITTKVWSVKRCPRMGSCKDEKCSKVFKDTLLPELEQVNNFTGNTGCSESCGGAGCDCFYLSSGCLFYRIYAVPKSEESHEIYKCTEYEPIAHLAVTVTRLNGWKNRAKTVIMGLKIGQTSEIWNNTITLDNVWTPPSPILNNWFIRNDKATALWPIGKWPQLRCNEKLQNCVLKEDCQCQPAQEEMRCACEDNDWDTLFTDVKAHLPIQEGHWKMENEKESVIARMKISAEAKIVVKLREEWDTVTYVSNDQCVAETTPATGCYNCASGVTVEFDCKSLQRDTIANVNCETEQFTIPCSTTGEKSTMTFFADKAKFRRICRIDCGGKKVQNIEITGVLKFSGSIWTSVYRMLQGNTTVFNEINIPDVGHLLDSYLSYMKTVILVLMVVGIVFLFTYSAITNAGTAIISTMLKIMSTLMWIAIRICIRVIQLPLNVVQNLRRRRRHAHLHTLVFFILFTPLIVACGKSQTMFTDSTSELENSSILSSSFHLSSHRSNSSLHLCDYNSYRSHRPLDVSTPMYPSDTYQFQIAEIMVKNVLEKLQEKMEEVQEELKRTNPDIWETTNRKIDKIQSSLDMLNQKLDHILEDMDQLVAGGAPPASQGDQEDFGIQIQLEEDMEIDHEETVEIPEDRRRRSSGQLRVDEVIDEDAEEDIDKGDEEELQEDDDDEMDEEVEENPPRVKSTVMVPPPRSLKIQRSENAGQVSRLTRNIYIKPVNRMKRRCIYCRGQHFSDNCPKVEEPKERRTFLKENRFCDKCLKAIEREHRCRPEEIKACFYCGVDTHHTSICEVPRHQHLNQPPRSVKKKEAARKYFEKLQNRRH